MSTEDLVRGYLAALFAREDVSRFLAADVSWTTMETGEEVVGRDHVVAFLAALHTQIFDSHPELRSLVVEGSYAVAEATLNGVHIGDLGGFPPTGDSFVAPYAVVFETADGTITRMRGYLPMTWLLTEISADTVAPI